MKKNLLYLLLLIPCISYAQSPNKPSVSNTNAVTQLIQDQQDAWNRGDINAFMEGYWKSDQLVFVGGSGPIYGWKKTRKNYHDRYPSRDAMGTLTFELIDIVQLDKKVIRVIGSFYLERTIGDVGGYFTLIFKKLNNRWLIVSDHTSVNPDI